MNTQHPNMEILHRKTSDLNEAFYDLEIDAETAAMDEFKCPRPHFARIYLTDSNIKDFFEIKRNSEFMIKVFIFDSQEEKDKYLRNNLGIEGNIRSN